MTIGKLQKILAELVEAGHGRKRVCVQKNTFANALEADGAVILNVETACLMSFPMMDDDGFTKIRADGVESCHTSVVLSGDHDPLDDL